MADSEVPESVRVTLTVVRALEELGIRYVIGGSMASTVHGVVRSTLDVDIVVDIEASDIEPFLGKLGADFYGDARRALDAVAREASFNLIERNTMFKVDIFVAGQKSFEHSQIDRRRSMAVGPKSGERIYVLTPEDTVLAKLVWYRKGGEVSERQWRDIQGVLSVQREAIDRAYILRESAGLRVDDLARRAFDEADEEG